MATVLVADDDTAGRLLVHTVLEHWATSWLKRRAGPGVLAAAADARPICCCSISGLAADERSGGAARTARRRSDARRSVALYTATPTSAALRDLMEIYGVVAAIPKPSEPQELIEAVERALRKT